MGGALGAGDVCVQYMNVCVCVFCGVLFLLLCGISPQRPYTYDRT